MCWWADTCSCLTSRCFGYTLINPKWKSQREALCPNPGCTDRRPCNTRDTPRALPSSLSPCYRRLCDDCLSGIGRRWKLEVPIIEIQCRKCERYFSTENRCWRHVSHYCPQRQGDMFGRMWVTIRDVSPDNEFLLPRIDGPAVHQLRVWPFQTGPQQGDIEQPPPPQLTFISYDAMEVDPPPGPSRQIDLTAGDSSDGNSHSSRQGSLVPQEPSSEVERMEDQNRTRSSPRTARPRDADDPGGYEH